MPQDVVGATAPEIGGFHSHASTSELRYRTILESAIEYAIIAFDLNGAVVEWNAGAKAIMGWTEAEMLGREALMIFTPEDRAAGVPAAEMRRATDQGRAVDERWHMHADGGRFWGSGLMMPLHDADGALAGHLKIMQDRTVAHELGRTLEELEMVLSGGLWRTHADLSQSENALLNLAVNARDAMKGTGRLTVETANCHLDDDHARQHEEVAAGQYVLLAVTDTGSGMSSEVIARAFDPFFTTKLTGAGTGLGLSQVYGFVKQSAGHLKIYSELGQGTTLKIYLPRFVGQQEAIPAPARLTAALPGRIEEVILVVEDEDRVRQLAVDALRDLSYTVIHAETATVALRQLDAHPGLTLMFTDIVMPGMNGRKLADEAVERRPDLPCCSPPATRAMPSCIMVCSMPA